MAEATRGNIEWLLQEDPSLFSALAEKASQLITHPEQRLQLRDEFSDLVERYNNIAKKTGEQAYVPPDELIHFAADICEYFWENRSK